MGHPLVSILSNIAIYILAGSLPVLWVLFTDRFRQPPGPNQYAMLFVIVAALGIMLFLPAISIIAGVGLVALGFARLSARLSLTGLVYDRTLTPERLFAGDRAQLSIRLANHKLLPLAWLRITDPIHFTSLGGADLASMLHISDGVEVLETQQQALVLRTALSPFQDVTRVYEVEGRQRGVYSLGPATAASGDPFGLFPVEGVVADRADVIVYPRLYRPDEIGLPFRQAMGEILARRALVEDPTLIAGSREYRPGDPLRRIHWKATARTGELQVRQLDASTTAQVMMVLNLNTSQHVWQGVDVERMEAAVSVAASLALWALEKGYQVGLRSNGIIPGLQEAGRLAASAHPRQSTYLLEHLARISYAGNIAPEAVLQDEVRRLSPAGTVVFVTPMITPNLIRVLTSSALSSRVSVVYCGRRAAPVVPGVSIHLAIPPSEEHRAVS